MDLIKKLEDQLEGLQASADSLYLSMMSAREINKSDDFINGMKSALGMVREMQRQFEIRIADLRRSQNEPKAID